jgi:glycosyltransferase involved in cell wall biosynthesis
VVWTTVSQASAAAMRPLLPAGPRVVPNAVDLSFWQPPARTARRGVGAGLHVVAVGRLVPRKRPMDVVAVLYAARQQLPPEVPLRATLVGDGPERGRLARFLAWHDMAGWVRLAGNLSPSRIRDVLADADVFLAPATLESFGIAALEARTAGVPVLARTGTGVADFVRHGRDGLLAADRQGLAAALVRLHHEPALLAAITAHNRARLPEGFGWPTVTAAFERCYAQAQARIAAAPLIPAAVPADLPSTPVRPAPRARSRARG